MLMNFCDSSFCIGTSTQDKNLRYLKQIKVRAGEYCYTADNVALCRIEKPTNFLGFYHIGQGNEKEHLREKEEKNRAEQVARAKELHAQGLSYQKIANELNICKSSAENYVKE